MTSDLFSFHVIWGNALTSKEFPYLRNFKFVIILADFVIISFVSSTWMNQIISFNNQAIEAAMKLAVLMKYYSLVLDQYNFFLYTDAKNHAPGTNIHKCLPLHCAPYILNNLVKQQNLENPCIMKKNFL